VLLGEATVVGLLYQAYWEPARREGGPDAPGFADWTDGAALHAYSGYELLELVTAIGKAEADYVRANEAPARSPLLRAQAVLTEIKSTLEFLFDDAEYTVEDEKLEKLRITYRRPRSHKQVAAALEGYFRFATGYRAELRELRGFDLGMLDEALSLAQRLKGRPAELSIAKQFSGAGDAMARRNQLLALLRDRVGRIRRAARLVFANHPEVVRRFSSDYQRARRRTARAQVAAQGPGST
jgi:hypothetical protein